MPSQRWGGEKISISGREAHHLIHVLRLTPGMALTCFDGAGNEAGALVKRIGRDEILLELKDQRVVPPPAFPVTLGVAVPGHGKLDEIVNQAAQLGAAKIIPLLTSRTLLKKMPAAQSQRKKNRLEQIIVEAGKQSGVSRLPVLDPFTPWADLLSSFKDYGLVLIAAVEGPHESLTAVLSKKSPCSVLLLIGPEGDFAPGEVQQALKAGAHRISLGPTVLRCETAVVSALSVVSYLLSSS